MKSRSLFGSHVKELRKGLHLTQTQLGSIAGLDRSYISRIERGHCNVTLDSIMLIADGLGVAPSDLLDGVGIPLPPDNPALHIALDVSQEPQ